MIWHVIYVKDGIVRSTAARSVEHALDVADKLRGEAIEVRRIISPDGSTVNRSMIDR